MSAFQCNLTPTRVRNDRKRNEDREPTYVDLRPFTSKSIVVFEDVPVTKTARRMLIIANPFEEPLKVAVTRIPKPEFNISIEWTTNVIPPSSQLNLELIWNPVKVVSSREVIQICDVHGNKKDIAVVLKSCELKKPTGRKIAPVAFQRKLKMKTPSPPRFMNAQKQPMEVRNSPLRNVTNTSNVLQQVNFNAVSNADKENMQGTPQTALNLYENIRCTPVTETKRTKSDFNYLTSLPTPIGISREEISFSELVTNKNFQPCPRQLEPLLEEENKIGPMTKKVISFEEEIGGTTFVHSHDEIDEIEIVLTEPNQTKVLSNPIINVINDQNQTQVVFVEKTFHIDKSQIKTKEVSDQHKLNRSKSVMFVGENIIEYEEKRKLRINQGSMPNLHDVNVGDGTIEQNRYFRQTMSEHREHHQNMSNESVASNADFREHEFCAQSSQLNIEVSSPGKSSQPTSPIRSKQLLNVKMNENSPKVQSPLHLSPTMRRIQEEPEFSGRQSVFQFTFSPPRKSMSAETIRRETFVVPKKGQGIRATTWKQQQGHDVFKVPRDLKLHSTPRLSTQSLNSVSNSSINSVSSLPATLTTGRLYNENILVPNNDPFSATTTQDPFLSSTMYLNDRKLDSIEKAYIKWLNALVTVPADLESDKNEKIDVGKLFNDVQNKELTIAQTKEVVCSRYYTSRLDSLRSSAIRFYQSDAISSTFVKITAAVNNDKDPLGVKNERPIHLDLVLQRSLLELLLCFNPLWLRIGLEVVFNVQLNLTSNHDYQGMTRFIVTRMFKSQYILDKLGKLPSRRNEMLLQLRRHTVKHLLFVLFFLDRAKEHRLIKQNPCLFVRRAPYKDSNDILKKLASLVLSNYGDIMRLMKRYDFVLTHKQTVIDEYDYAFKNLAVDLRDGVRLTKVMEIILMRDDLVNKVRVPAISRLQKVHNVDLALKALEAAEYKILGDITAKDIADGHREKTLSLLWQIIYKFRAPKFNAAAKVIQKFWRSKYLLVVINRRIREKEEVKKIRAATTIQRFFRGWQARKTYRRHLHEVTQSCIVLQKYIRRFIVKTQFKRTMEKVVTIQNWYRQVRAVRNTRREFLHIKMSTIVIQKWWRRQMMAKKLVACSSAIQKIKQEAHRRHTATIVIQRAFKSYVIHKKFHSHINFIVDHNRQLKRTNSAAAKVQALFRMMKERRKFLETKNSSILIQRRWRHYVKGKNARVKFLIMKSSAMKIQNWFRANQTMKNQRNEFLRLKESAQIIQTRFRANLAMKKQKTEFHLIKSSAIIVQRRFRAQQEMKRQKMQFQTLKKSAITIQQKWRATLMMRRQKNEFSFIKQNTILIQRKLRATLLMRKQQNSFIKLKNATKVVQSQFRAQIAMRKNRSYFEVLKKMTIAIQRRFRANLEMKNQRSKFLKMRNAAVVMQRQFRAQKSMKNSRDHYVKLKKLTIHLQQRFRSTKEMKKLTVEFYSIQYYAGIIQQRYRANLAMRKQRKEFHSLKNAAICFQTRYRGRLMMKKEMKNYEKMKSATLKIQQRWRAILQMRKVRSEYVQLKVNVVKIQQRFIANLKCKKERKKFMTMKNSVKVIEERYLAVKAMRKSQNDYKTLKRATIAIQNRFRANQLMKVQRKSFKDTQNFVIKIQKYFRGYLRMKEQQEEYLRIKKSAVVIQTHFRAQKLMMLQRNEFKKLKIAVVATQRRFRATKAMKIQQEKYKQLRKSAIVLQSHYRARIAMRTAVVNYSELKLNSIKIQRKWRATMEMREQRKEFLKLKNSVIAVQRRYRAIKLRRICEKDFKIKKKSAIEIQRFYRGYIEMKKERKKFLEIQSAVRIQKRFRATLEMRKVKKELLQVRNSIVKIQRFYRATMRMRVEREVYMKSRNSIIFVQRLFKANQAMKLEREKYNQQKSAAIRIQRYFRGYIETAKQRNQFLQLKKSVIIIENRILANRLMKIEREKFTKLKTATIFIQKRFKSKILTQQTHQQFKQTRKLIIHLQTLIRGFLARRKFLQMQTPERLEHRRRVKAARAIQAAYRGYRERNKKSNRHFREIAQRLMKIAVRPKETLGEILKVSIRFLRQKTYESNDAINFLAKLEYMSRTVPWILTDQTVFIASYCYGCMGTAIRSEVDKIMIELCSCIILNLARYKDTNEDSFLDNGDNGLLTIAQMLLRWCDKDCGIFNTLCTVVWVFAHCQRKKMIIRNFMLMKDGEFLLQQMKQMVIRKENMRRNSRRPIGFQSISLTKYKKDYQLQLRYKSNVNEFSSGFITPQMLQQCRELPSLTSDFGVVKTNPYIFYSSVFAFDSVLKILSIDNIN